jgi:hypothetical protein
MPSTSKDNAAANAKILGTRASCTSTCRASMHPQEQGANHCMYFLFTSRMRARQDSGLTTAAMSVIVIGMSAQRQLRETNWTVSGRDLSVEPRQVKVEISYGSNRLVLLSFFHDFTQMQVCYDYKLHVSSHLGQKRMIIV